MRTDDVIDAGARKRVLRRPSRRHAAAIGVVLLLHVLLLAAIVVTSPLVHVDWWVMLHHPAKMWPEVKPFLDVYVISGQRAPSAALALAWLAWRSWRLRSWRPLIVAGFALLLLNVTVGAVKIGLGRLGPHYALHPWTSEILRGGDIMPSGHTANGVVTWGLLAYLATRHRKLGTWIAAFMAFAIGSTTIYLGTHWVSDVLDGWMAGLLVLLFLPLFEPLVTRADARMNWMWGAYQRRRTAKRLLAPARKPLPDEPLGGGKPAPAGVGRLRHGPEADADTQPSVPAPAKPQQPQPGQQGASQISRSSSG